MLPFPRVCGFNRESVGLYEGRKWQGRVFLESFHSYQIFGLCLVIIVCLIRANPKSTHEKINNHKRKAYQWCAGKCLISGFPGEKKKKLLILCTFCVFPWCKYSHHSQFQVNRLKSLNVEWGGDGHIVPPQLVQAGPSTLLTSIMCQEQCKVFYILSPLS